MNRLNESVSSLTERIGPQSVSPEDECAPVFIFAGCWRSGSTLLQRLCMSNRIIWGEPYEQAWLMENLSAPLRQVSSLWPPEHYLYSGQSVEHIRTFFCANLYPPLSSLRAAYQKFFMQLFGDPSIHESRAWGAKFVRGSAEEAAWLRWLFPKCKLLFLIRNPYDCLQSLIHWQASGTKVYDRFPDIPVTPTRLADVWQRNTRSFLEAHESLGGKVVRYEQLVTGDFAEVEDYLGYKLQTDALASGKSPAPVVADKPLINNITRQAFTAIVEPLAQELGYANTLPAEQTEVVVTGNDPAPPEKVCVLVPVATHVEPACEAGLRSLEAEGYVVRRVRGFSAIDQARNALACGALRDGFDEILWIDSDIGFHLRDVQRLRSHNEPIACGIYPKKGKRELACHVMPGEKSILFGGGGQLMELTYCGAGFLSIKRKVFEDIQSQLNLPLCNEHFGEAIVPFFQPLIRESEGRRWYLAEDYAFCERARQCGYKIMADTTIRLRHIGSYEYSWEDAGIARDRFATFRLNLPEPKP